MPSLAEIAKEWEMDDGIRAHLRETKRLLVKEAWDEDVKINVDFAEKNYPVLKPLVRRLLDEDGNVGMHSVPDMLVQINRVYLLMKLAPPNKKELKKDAKNLKKFLGLVKRKLQRQQVPRSELFRRLMSLVYDPDEKDPLMEATQGEGEDTQAGEESEGDEEEEEEEERDGAHEGHDETKSQPPNPPEPSSHGSQLVLDEPSHDPSQLGVIDLVESPVDSPLPCKKLFHEEDHEDVHTNTFEMNSVSLDEPMTEEQRSEQIASKTKKSDKKESESADKKPDMKEDEDEWEHGDECENGDEHEEEDYEDDVAQKGIEEQTVSHDMEAGEAKPDNMSMASLKKHDEPTKKLEEHAASTSEGQKHELLGVQGNEVAEDTKETEEEMHHGRKEQIKCDPKKEIEREEDEAPGAKTSSQQIKGKKRAKSPKEEPEPSHEAPKPRAKRKAKATVQKEGSDEPGESAHTKKQRKQNEKNEEKPKEVKAKGKAKAKHMNETECAPKGPEALPTEADLFGEEGMAEEEEQRGVEKEEVTHGKPSEPAPKKRSKAKEGSEEKKKEPTGASRKKTSSTMEAEEEEAKVKKQRKSRSQPQPKEPSAIDTKDEEEPEPEHPKPESKKVQRKRSSTTSSPTTFARRKCPATSFGKLKWEVLRKVFGEGIKPHLQAYSAHEEPL
ncbi:Cyclin-related protein [Durusdinium trenchii]|uniref:Putative n=1 Tax=Durusdinium trenchii TaxID=1381693 RepID=A0ABP0S318_9DINO